MQELIQELREIEGVENVKKMSGPVLKINLFHREIPGSEAVDIPGDLRKISQRIRNTLEDARSRGDLSGWEWVVKPEKKYQETSLGKQKVSDRKTRGHKPGFYRVAIEN